MAGISDIRGIRITGGCFSETTDLMLFVDAEKRAGNGEVTTTRSRASVVYGVNGAGKTSISRTLAKYAQGSLEDGDLAFIDGAGGEISFDGTLDSIAVFNEEFLRKTVLVEDSGIGTIVMFGDQGENKERLDEIEEQLADSKDELDKTRKSYEEALAASMEGGILERTAKEAAKSGGWSARSAGISGTRTNLTGVAWTRIAGAKTERQRTELEAEFQSTLAKYDSVRGLTDTVSGKLSQYAPAVPDEDGLVKLLGMSLERPELTEREQLLMSLVEQGHQRVLEFARGRFRDSSTERCPICLQKLAPEYKESLVKSIESILSDEVDAYKARIQSIVFTLPELDEALTSYLSEGLRLELGSCHSRLAELIWEYQQLLERRLDNLYERLEIEPLGLAACVGDYTTLLERADSEIESLNDSVRHARQLRAELVNLNDQIAWIDCRAQLQALEEEKTKAEVARAKALRLEPTIATLERQREDLLAKQRNTSVAADLINKYLSIVFFDRKRMTLRPLEGMYEIRCNGHAVLPAMVSEGERNVLGLCYFFATIGKDGFSNEVDTKPRLVVLDDPISSVDAENRVGIHSLIRSRACGMLTKNDETSLAILTHDLGVAFDLEKGLNEIPKLLPSERRFCVTFQTLSNKELKKASKRKGVYSDLLRRTYLYARGDADDAEDFVIGNIMRRLLEAYMQFNYGLDIDSLSLDEELIRKMGGLGDVLSNMTYRLALNNESHFNEAVWSLGRQRDFEGFSAEEKRVIARRVLVLLDVLDSVHVKKIAAKADGINLIRLQNDLQDWRREIESVC